MATRPYDPTSFSALNFEEAAADFAGGRDTPSAYLERCLATIREHEPTVQAFVCLNVDGACAAAEAIVSPVTPYVFKTPQKDSDAVRRIFETMRDLGISKIGVTSANTGFGNAGKGQLEKIAPEYDIEIAISETYDKTATDLTSVVTKIKAQDVQGVVNWSIVPATTRTRAPMPLAFETVPTSFTCSQ